MLKGDVRKNLRQVIFKYKIIAVFRVQKVDAAVREIIEERMDLGQFDECDITMADLDIIRKTITNSLAGVYHDRVEYPKLRIGKK